MAQQSNSEQYLQELCRRAYLDLWAYPCPYKDQGKTERRHGKELCDLLIVFGDHVLVFEDKHIRLRVKDDLRVGWKRWYQDAVVRASHKVRSAARWISDMPERVYQDSKCTVPLFAELPPKDRLVLHRIVVCRGAADECRKRFGGSGTLMVESCRISDCLATPFTQGTFNDKGEVIHVFDEETLDRLILLLDTPGDLIAYLNARTTFLKSGLKIHAAGEEEILAIYLTNVNANNEHYLPVPMSTTAMVIQEGFFFEFSQSEARSSQVAANLVSYAWDRLLDKFIRSAQADDQSAKSAPPMGELEQLLRWMAKQRRTLRRVLAKKLIQVCNECPRGGRRLAVFFPQSPSDAAWLFFSFSKPESLTEDEYLELRFRYLISYVLVLKYLRPQYSHFAGIALNGFCDERGTESCTYLYEPDLSPEDFADAKRLHEEDGLLKDVAETSENAADYPNSLRRPVKASKVRRKRHERLGRNSPCHCGSGLRYKDCHLRRDKR